MLNTTYNRQLFCLFTFQNTTLNSRTINARDIEASLFRSFVPSIKVPCVYANSECPVQVCSLISAFTFRLTIGEIHTLLCQLPTSYFCVMVFFPSEKCAKRVGLMFVFM